MSGLGNSREPRAYQYPEAEVTQCIFVCFWNLLVFWSRLQSFPDSDPHPEGEHRNRAAQFAAGGEECRSGGN